VEKRTKFYVCDPKERQSHVIPAALIWGATEISLVAAMEGIAWFAQKVERRHARNAIRQGKSILSPELDVIHYRLVPDYKPLLFPSQATGSADVFRLKVAVGEPPGRSTSFFAATPDALK
jgi:hypothetical protein